MPPITAEPRCGARPRPTLRRASFDASRFRPGTRIGLIALQHESNCYAPGSTSADAFSVHEAAEITREFAGTGTEIAGALAAIEARGGHIVPILAAHALPSAPLVDECVDRLLARLTRALERADSSQRLDGLVVVLHGASTAINDVAFDATILDRIGATLGRRVPLAATFDLHGNVTARLLRDTTVSVGYATNPHVDQAEVGARAVELLAASLDGSLHPVRAIASCPAMFPDETLRLPGGLLDEVLAPVFARLPATCVEVGLFPTQPWLDAPGVGFTVVVTADRDPEVAARAAVDLAAAVWDRRHEFVVPELAAPQDALRRAAEVTARPAVVTEAADAPTAGAAGDGTAMLRALVTTGFRGRALLTIADPYVVSACDGRPTGSVVAMSVGGRLDPRWGEPVPVTGRILGGGDGAHVLSGPCGTGRPVTMGRWTVLQVEIPGPGIADLLVTEMPAWSGDPAPWVHAGLDPWHADLVVVRSCSDYLASFPHCVGSSVIVDSPGPASPRLDRLPYARVRPAPYPARSWRGVRAEDAVELAML